MKLFPILALTLALYIPACHAAPLMTSSIDTDVLRSMISGMSTEISTELGTTLTQTGTTLIKELAQSGVYAVAGTGLALCGAYLFTLGCKNIFSPNAKNEDGTAKTNNDTAKYIAKWLTFSALGGATFWAGINIGLQKIALHSLI